MYARRGNLDTKNNVDAGLGPLVAIAIDSDKTSQNALRWTIDNLGSKGQALVLVHVNTKATSSNGNRDDGGGGFKQPTDQQMKELFLPFRCYCKRKAITCKDVLLEEPDISKAIVEFISQAAIEKMVLGAPSKSGFVRRFKSNDISSSVIRNAPDFCTVYVISKTKVSSVRNSVRPAPSVSPLRAQIQSEMNTMADSVGQSGYVGPRGSNVSAFDCRSIHEDSIRSPFSRGLTGSTPRSYADFSFTDSDISFVSSSGRPSVDRAFQSRLSNASDRSYDLVQTPAKSIDSFSTGFSMGNEFSSISDSSVGTGTSWSSMNMEDVETEIKRLRLELKQTMEMYSTACKEALAAKQKASELHQWKIDEEEKLEKARIAAEGAAMEQVEKEKAKCKEAIEKAQEQEKIAEHEAHKRLEAEKKALQECEEKKRALGALLHKDVKYRRYSIDEIEVATEKFAAHRKIGEGGYGPVFKCYLDHTPVAVKVLRPDAAQGRSQFQQEVEILSCIRHPNMVLLLGACPEYGCLVYEYMANGSLDDRLFRRGNTPVIPWQQRFRIAAEIATGLLFLHQTKPEPLVHRDLKPGNILLDHNYSSKISDVGLARLVPPSVADTVTQYRMTSTAGTFCYIDPEYQQTGMLGVKSDIYSLGIMLLQIITARPPMGLAHHVAHAIENGTLSEMLDPAVTDWPVEEVKKFAELSIKCAELRRKDRPDLCTEILPELTRLRALAEENMQHIVLQCSAHSSPACSQASMQDDVTSASQQSGFSSRTQSSTSSMAGN